MASGTRGPGGKDPVRGHAPDRPAAASPGRGPGRRARGRQKEAAPNPAADAYERELRERLSGQGDGRAAGARLLAPRRLLQGAVALLVLVGLGLGLHAWRQQELRERAGEVARALEAAHFGLARDTLASVRASAAVLQKALERDPGNGEVAAWLARAHATLAVTFGTGEADRARAVELLAHGGVDPGSEAALFARWLLAAPPRTEIEEAILAATPAEESAGLHDLAGRILLERGEVAAAIERFNGALREEPGHVPTLVAVGGHFAARSEYDEALRYFERALAVAEEHPGALIGDVEARLATVREEKSLREALRALERIGDEENVPVAERERHALVRSRLAVALGERELALQALEARLPTLEEPERVAAWVESWLRAGAADRAARFFEGFDPATSSEPALREAWGRVLLGLERYEDAASLEPERGEAGLHVVVGIARFHLGALQEAKHSLRRSAPPGKRSPEVLAYLGLIDWAQGRRESARKSLERIGTGHRAHTVGRWAWARLLIEDRRWDEAEQVLAAALEREPEAVELRCTLGRLLHERGREEAVENLRLAVQGNPLHSEARRALARALASHGEHEAAAGEWKEVLRRHPRDVEALGGLVLLELERGAVEEASRWLEEARSVEAQHRAVLIAQAGLARQRGDWREAAAALQRAAPRLGDAEVWRELGELQLALEQAGPAAASFRRALALRAGWPEARIGLARAGVLEGRAAPAERQLRALIEGLGEGAPAKVRGLARAALAEALLAQGKGFAAKASQAASEAIELYEPLPLGHLLLARAWDILGEATSAARHLERARALSPHLPALLLELGRQGQGREPATAAAALRRYLELVPKGPQARQARRLLASLES